MSSTLRIRHILKGLVVTRLFSAWTRSYLLNSVVKRCRRDRGVREVIQCFRQAFFRPKQTLLLYATAAYKRHEEEGSSGGDDCTVNISDEDLQALVTDLDGVEELSRATLYCPGCALRVMLDKRQPGVRYCGCADSKPPKESFHGWVPYMEAEDVIIWRKEYKPGQGLYAYKVYGRYKEVRAQDFAAIQVDGGYRRAWDNAVAALAVVDRRANGVRDQAVLHWEVLWPRLFANRDYVYIRRHKEFSVKTKCLFHKEGIFNPKAHCDDPPAKPEADAAQKPATKDTHKPHKATNDSHKPVTHKPEGHHERPSVHSNAKRKAMENNKSEKYGDQEDKVYVIISRSCTHPQVPATRHAIRVTEYWSNMVVKTLNGPDKPGAEFVLTYYDEPAVGGMPSAVASFATARGAPAFLARMRQASLDYSRWRKRNHQDDTDFVPFGPEKVSYDDLKTSVIPISEQDMESSKQGPDLDNGYKGQTTQDQGTQTDNDPPPPLAKAVVEPLSLQQDLSVGCQTEISQKAKPIPRKQMDEVNKVPPNNEDFTKTQHTVTEVEEVNESLEAVTKKPEAVTKKPEGTTKQPQGATKKPDGVASDLERVAPEKESKKEGDDGTIEGDSDKTEDCESKSGWYRYLYPFYYFV